MKNTFALTSWITKITKTETEIKQIIEIFVIKMTKTITTKTTTTFKTTTQLKKLLKLN